MKGQYHSSMLRPHDTNASRSFRNRHNFPEVQIECMSSWKSSPPMKCNVHFAVAAKRFYSSAAGTRKHVHPAISWHMLLRDKRSDTFLRQMELGVGNITLTNPSFSLCVNIIRKRKHPSNRSYRPGRLHAISEDLKGTDPSTGSERAIRRHENSCVNIRGSISMLRAELKEGPNFPANKFFDVRPRSGLREVIPVNSVMIALLSFELGGVRRRA